MQDNPVPIPTESAAPTTTQPAHHAHLKLAHRARQHLAVELVLGLFGLYGVGFLLSGKIRGGIGSLLFSAVWLVARLALLAGSGGLALIFLLPLTFIFAISHTFTLRRILRQALIAHASEQI